MKSQKLKAESTLTVDDLIKYSDDFVKEFTKKEPVTVLKPRYRNMKSIAEMNIRHFIL